MSLWATTDLAAVANQATGGIMEAPVRRKFASKDKPDPFFGAPALQITLWRPWSFFLLLGCVFVITGGSYWSSYASVAMTAVTNNLQRFSRLPAITTGEVAIPTLHPMPSIYVQDAVVFPDNVMLLVRVSKSVNLEESKDSLDCRFGGIPSESENNVTSPVLSIDPWTKGFQIVRCRCPESDYESPSKIHSNVTLGIRQSEIRAESNAFYHPHTLPTWKVLVYENLIDADSLVLLGKGLVDKSMKRINVQLLKCVFGTKFPSEILYETEVSTAAQEVIRCKKPPSHMDEKLRGSRVSIKATWLGVLPSVTYYDPDHHPKNFLASFRSKNFSATADESQVSLEGDFQIEEDKQAVVSSEESPMSKSPLQQGTTADEENLLKQPAPKTKLCACTMVWNKGQFIREWVLFHSFMGVEKYFVYDNDSDDNTEEVLDSLSDYNVSRMVWPWIKTQQAAFSHCTILARDQCEAMLFTDVDEYIYPIAYLHKGDPEPSDAMVLHRLMDAENRSAEERGENMGQIQFECLVFGPSGLDITPEEGVTVGYTCRMKKTELHKSIVILDALDYNLLNVLHHFDLRRNYHTVRLTPNIAVCNHYKYQAWDAHKMKYVRRAGTYTLDWQTDEKRVSNQMPENMGADAVKPAGWLSKACEVEDKGLEEFVRRTFALLDEPNKMVWQLDQSAPGQ